MQSILSLNQLDASCLVSRDDIVTGILEASRPTTPVAMPIVPLTTPVIKKELAVLPVEKAKAASPITAIIDPKKLKVPGERFQGKASNTWLVWGWAIASSLNLVTLENGERKFHSFKLQDVVQGVVQKKGMRIKDTTVYSALDVMVTREWLTFNSTTKRYTLSPVAQRWTQIPKNHSYLVEKGFLDPIE